MRNDFSQHCGYCDDDDFYSGGSRGYQIDHFKPKCSFPDDVNDYDNLVYSCPYCNRSKWDTWREEDGFIDPCEDGYDEHIIRRDDGSIGYEGSRGKFIFEELNLGLKRHQIIWTIKKLESQNKKLAECIEELRDSSDKRDSSGLYLKVLEQFFETQQRIKNYLSLLRESQ
ncbi:HNH endonuclease signature motif containing protein [Coraliomargarita sp. SDUM461003]|uniref:HNH endonuclease signature motif containing protein n=1 Tax=Thalassobacterium maritimum TaxID=3041265 RepID=A0ABU1AP06_9BACT|nr:HNH endonuclease signature motif containing protein [Coraliomargarita sp. SDUM461003]MDQ8205898.1 HNH endonuclease signature motif containing protein [Coraliomargarita sp. SDUM461003]